VTPCDLQLTGLQAEVRPQTGGPDVLQQLDVAKSRLQALESQSEKADSIDSLTGEVERLKQEVTVT